MVKAIFGTTDIKITSNVSSAVIMLRYCDYPECFGHPRQLVSNPAKAADVLRPTLRSLMRWMMPPKVIFHIEATLEGGVTPVDLRSITDAFTFAGARAVRYDAN
ncbi:MAG: hypothetical protein ABJC04_13265 [Verrucomicrobiota bacterium]